MTTEEWNDKPAGGPTMTPTTLAATILRDVKLYEPDWTKEPYDRSEMVESTVGDWLSRDEVLAALTTALDPALSERAALTVLRLRSGLDNADRGADGERELGGVVLTMNDAADLITALLAQNAAIREAWEKAYWRMRSYAVHDNDCKLNKPPHFDGPCSCGLTAALEDALALIQMEEQK